MGCYTANRWIARASGGVDFFIDVGMTSGVYLSAGGSSWNVVSSRVAQENLVLVDGRALLERLAAIEIGAWNYKAQAPAIRHVGPQAGLGGEGQDSSNSLDAEGVALAAIQALHRLNQTQQAQLASQQQQIERLEVGPAILGQCGQPDRSPWLLLLASLATGLLLATLAVVLLRPARRTCGIKLSTGVKTKSPQFDGCHGCAALLRTRQLVCTRR